MGAVLIGSRVIEMLQGATFRHGFTYNGHDTGAAIALANLALIERERLLDRAVEMGRSLLESLKPLEALPSVREVRGVGLMLGIEITGDDASPVAAGARAQGVIVRATGQKIVLSPPLVIEQSQVERIAEVLHGELSRL
jgi:putrescine aminotransferase